MVEPGLWGASVVGSNPTTPTTNLSNHVLLDDEHREARESLQPWELERAVTRFVDYYKPNWLHEVLGNVAPDDVYRGRQREIVSRRAKIKRLTLERGKKEDLRDAA